jgi:hypothetical protein
MKRIELLKQSTEKQTDFSGVVKKDELTLNNLKSNVELEILNIESSIDDYMSNPKLTLDNDFLNLISEKSILENRLKNIEIAKSYL